MSSGVGPVEMSHRNPLPVEEEVDKEYNTPLDTPEEGKMEKVFRYAGMAEKKGWKGTMISVAMIGGAIFLFLVILPGFPLHFNIYSPTSSMNNLPMLAAITLLGTAGLIGLGSQFSGNKTLKKIWTVLTAILPFALSACAVWWGVDTMKILAEKCQMWTGPWNWAALAVGGGFIYGTSMVSTTLFV